MTSLRVFFVGGMTSYRALFSWLSPWILVPVFVVGPIFQILLFAYVGRTADVGSDEYFLIGNAVQYAAIPCLFAMGNTIGGERQTGTLGLLLVSPARRVPLFLGRALPVVLNGFCVAVVALVTGGLLLGVRVPMPSVAPLVLSVAVSTISCTGLGLAAAALALRVRETAVLTNIVFGVLLIFCGVNVPLGELPEWMRPISHSLPLTHGIAAARSSAAGRSFATVAADLRIELLLGVVYVALGLVMLAWFERESRRLATLEAY